MQAGCELPAGISQKYFDYLQDCGWSAADIERIACDLMAMKSVMNEREEARENPNHRPRDVTCSTYERAQARLTKEVSDWMGN